jgi:hypothetical protein
VVSHEAVERATADEEEVGETVLEDLASRPGLVVGVERRRRKDVVGDVVAE